MARNMILPLIALAFTAIGISANAEDSYYDVLKQEFSRARDSITEDHIPKSGDLSKTCVIIDSHSPDDERIVLLRRVSTTKRGRGGVLGERKIVKVIVVEGTLDPDPQHLSKEYRTTFRDREIETRYFNEKLKVRRKSDWLFFERAVTYTDNQAESEAEANSEASEPDGEVEAQKVDRSYGFCYPSNS